jgi:hypothetical protein
MTSAHNPWELSERDLPDPRALAHAPELARLADNAFYRLLIRRERTARWAYPILRLAILIVLLILGTSGSEILEVAVFVGILWVFVDVISGSIDVVPWNVGIRRRNLFGIRAPFIDDIIHSPYHAEDIACALWASRATRGTIFLRRSTLLIGLAIFGGILMGADEARAFDGEHIFIVLILVLFAFRIGAMTFAPFHILPSITRVIENMAPALHARNRATCAIRSAFAEAMSFAAALIVFNLIAVWPVCVLAAAVDISHYPTFAEALIRRLFVTSSCCAAAFAVGAGYAFLARRRYSVDLMRAAAMLGIILRFMRERALDGERVIPHAEAEDIETAFSPSRAAAAPQP